jgi:RNase P/RNase MRP subunit p29
MREFIGHKVKIAVEGIGAVEGTVVNDTKAILFVKGTDGAISRVPKSKICLFVPVDFEPFDYIPFYVLRCFNKKTGCPGVRYVKRGDEATQKGFTQADFQTFMEDCQCRCETCSAGSQGELRTVKGEVLSDMLTDTIFGDYPEPKEEEKSGSSRPSRETGEGAGDQTEDGDGEESSGRATQHVDEPED